MIQMSIVNVVYLIILRFCAKRICEPGNRRLAVGLLQNYIEKKYSVLYTVLTLYCILAIRFFLKILEHLQCSY